MQILGYLCVSNDKQDLRKQEHLLRQYAQQHHIEIGSWLQLEISPQRSTRERSIDKLLARLKPGDVMLVAELNCLGRSLFEVINLINQISARDVKLLFVRQPELSTTGPEAKALLTIFSYFAEAEREFLSLRIQKGVATARTRGTPLGRPKGSRDKIRMLDPQREQIKEYLRLTLLLRRICALINPQLSRPLTYPAYRYFVRQDAELLALWQGQRGA